MATVHIVVTDSPDEHVMIRIESENPELPLDGDGNPDVDNLTNAQAFAIGVLMEISTQVGEMDWRTFLRA